MAPRETHYVRRRRAKWFGIRAYETICRETSSFFTPVLFPPLRRVTQPGEREGKLISSYRKRRAAVTKILRYTRLPKAGFPRGSILLCTASVLPHPLSFLRVIQSDLGSGGVGEGGRGGYPGSHVYILRVRITELRGLSLMQGQSGDVSRLAVNSTRRSVDRGLRWPAVPRESPSPETNGMLPSPSEHRTRVAGKGGTRSRTWTSAATR